EDVGQLLQRVQRGDFPRPRQMKRSVPADLEAICLKAMAVAPGDRYSSPRELAKDVEQALAGEPVSAWREPRGFTFRRWLRRQPSLLLAIYFIAIVGFVALGVMAAAPWFVKPPPEQESLLGIRVGDSIDQVVKKLGLPQETNRGDPWSWEGREVF